MLIRLIANPQDSVIAREDQLGNLEAKFVLTDSEAVLYRHPDDDREWLAGISRAQFVAAAIAWNAYCETVMTLSEEEQQELVVALRANLASAGVLALTNSVWSVLLEQAEAGLL